jgi:hypothetical protein
MAMIDTYIEEVEDLLRQPPTSNGVDDIRELFSGMLADPLFCTRRGKVDELQFRFLEYKTELLRGKPREHGPRVHDMDMEGEATGGKVYAGLGMLKRAQIELAESKNPFGASRGAIFGRIRGGHAATPR